MPITPEDATNLAPEEMKLVLAIERKIDNFLKEHHYPNEESCFAFEEHGVRVPTGRIINELIRRYKDAGWGSVEFVTVPDAQLLTFRNR